MKEFTVSSYFHTRPCRKTHHSTESLVPGLACSDLRHRYLYRKETFAAAHIEPDI